MASDLDNIMDLDPLKMTSDNIDGVIAYVRKNRATAGTKAKKETGPKAEGSSLLDMLGLKKPKPEAPKTTGSGFRRL